MSAIPLIALSLGVAASGVLWVAVGHLVWRMIG